MKNVFQIVKSMLRPYYLYARISWLERQRWRHADRETDCRVYYGHDRFSSKDELASGGVVKFQDLQEIFPNFPHRPNLLYLLSNYLPLREDIVVKTARRHGAKFILNQNGVAYPAWHGPGWEQTNAPMAFLLKEADYVFYQSRFCKVSADHFAEKRDCDYEILYNPIDTARFVPKKPGNKIIKSRLKLLMTGSYYELYRVVVALHVLKNVVSYVPDAHLTIAGRLVWKPIENEALCEMMDMARKLNVDRNVTFAGAYTQKDVLTIYQNNHIFLHTKHNDPCPRVVLEAMACGLPVVYSSSGGLPELVSKEAGIGIPAPLDWNVIHEPEPEKMAEAVIKIVSAYDSYSSAARNHAVKKFDVRPWIQRHEAVFRKLLSE